VGLQNQANWVIQHWRISMNNNKNRQSAVKLGIILAVTAMATPGAFARNDIPRILPPSPHSYYGMTYGEWSAKWWAWNNSMPVDQHPLFDTADCSARQLGTVWFLGGTSTATDRNGETVWSADRVCNVPRGTALFFPVINSEAATLEGDGEGDEALRAQAERSALVPFSVSIANDAVPFLTAFYWLVLSAKILSMGNFGRKIEFSLQKRGFHFLNSGKAHRRFYR
jgi:hypothetical protein